MHVADVVREIDASQLGASADGRHAAATEHSSQALGVLVKAAGEAFSLGLCVSPHRRVRSHDGELSARPLPDSLAELLRRRLQS